MSERGVFAVDRGIWDHDFLADDAPLSRREAWLWLLSEAAWKPRTRRIAGRQIDLKRGQVVASLRFIASKWRWTEPRVRRFLAGLMREQMVDASSDAGVTVVTICNYDNYQRVSLPTDAMRETDVDAATTQQRRKTEDIKTIEYSEANASGAEAPPDPSEPERQFFKRGREILGKSSGGQLAKLLKAAGGNVSLARSKIELAATKDSASEFIARVITAAGTGPPAKPLTQHQIERQESREILNDLQKFIDDNSGGRSDADLGILRFDPGDGQKSLHGGPGRDLIDLSARRGREGG